MPARRRRTSRNASADAIKRIARLKAHKREPLPGCLAEAERAQVMRLQASANEAKAQARANANDELRERVAADPPQRVSIAASARWNVRHEHHAHRHDGPRRGRAALDVLDRSRSGAALQDRSSLRAARAPRGRRRARRRARLGSPRRRQPGRGRGARVRSARGPMMFRRRGGPAPSQPRIGCDSPFSAWCVENGERRPFRRGLVMLRATV